MIPPEDTCGEVVLTTEMNEVICDLPPGHSGKHYDPWNGWEWR